MATRISGNGIIKSYVRICFTSKAFQAPLLQGGVWGTGRVVRTAVLRRPILPCCTGRGRIRVLPIPDIRNSSGRVLRWALPSFFICTPFPATISILLVKGVCGTVPGVLV